MSSGTAATSSRKRFIRDGSYSDLAWWYAAPVSGLGLSDNSLEVRVAPDQNGGPAKVTLSPWLDDLTLENRTSSGRLGDSSAFDVYREPGTNRFVALGNVLVQQRQYVAVADPNRYTAAAFRQVLAEAGIAVAGATRSTTDSLLFEAARATPPLAEVASRPLSDWLFPILDSSQNWYAEMLLKQLGRQFGQAGSWSGPRELPSSRVRGALHIVICDLRLKRLQTA